MHVYNDYVIKIRTMFDCYTGIIYDHEDNRVGITGIHKTYEEAERDAQNNIDRIISNQQSSMRA